MKERCKGLRKLNEVKLNIVCFYVFVDIICGLCVVEEDD